MGMAVGGNMQYESKSVLHTVGTSCSLSAFTTICYIWTKAMIKAKLLLRDDGGPITKIKIVFISVTSLMWVLLFLGQTLRWTQGLEIIWEISQYIEALWILVTSVAVIVTSTRVLLLAHAHPTKKKALSPYIRMTICICLAAVCGFVLLVLVLLQTFDMVSSIASMMMLRLLNSATSYLAFFGFAVFNPNLRNRARSMVESMTGKSRGSSSQNNSITMSGGTQAAG